MSRRIAAVVAALVMSVPALGACSSASTDTTPAASGSELLAVTAPTVGGGEVDLATFAGRPVALWFWSPG